VTLSDLVDQAPVIFLKPVEHGQVQGGGKVTGRRPNMDTNYGSRGEGDRQRLGQEGRKALHIGELRGRGVVRMGGFEPP